MSLYTDYQKKIAPWAKAWHFVVKHKVLILSACAAVFVATGTLLGIKGIMVNDGLNADMNFSYGEKYHFGGDAIMGDVHYEYREIGSDTWTEVPPSDAGTYEVRACSKNSFGGTYYSQYKTFTIAKKESPLSIVGDQLTYGEKPKISMDMAPGDQIASFDYDYDDINKDNPIVTIKDVVIKDSVGKNVTGNYEFTLPSKEMELLPRPITIRGENVQVEYSGKATEGGQYKITYGSLADGDKIIAEHNNLPTYTLDTFDNITNVTIENGRGQDVTKHYQINLDKGSLSMTKRYLAITSASLSKEYDGKPFSVDDDPNLEKYTLNTELGLNDSLSVTFNAQTEKNVGTYDNDFSYHLDNSQYYVVEKNIGEITIRKRKLILDFEDSLTYNGDTFENRKSELCTVSGLVEGHTVHLEYVGETSFFPERTGVDISVLSSTGEDVTSNYEIIQNGWTTFKKQPLTITCNDVDAIYDGQVHSGSYTVEGLLGCDKIEWNSNVIKGVYPTYAEYSMSIGKIFNKETGESRTAYYDISYIPATFSIRKRHIEIDLAVDRAYTGGDSLTRDYEEDSGGLKRDGYLLSGDGLAEGDSLRLFPVISYQFDYNPCGVVCEILNSDGGDVTYSCYDVQFIGDEPKCSKAQLNIRAVDATLTYDGAWHSLEFVEEGLQPGDTVVYEDKPSFKDVDEYGQKITPRVKRIENSSGDDVTNLYNINVETGTLTIHTRDLIIGVDVNRTYDGSDACLSEYLSEDEYEFLYGTSLAPTDELKISLEEFNHMNDDPLPYLYSNSGEMFVSSDIRDKNTGDFTDHNYAVTFENPSYHGNKADLLLKGVDNTYVYDGNEHSGHWDVTGLQGSDKIYVKTDSLPQDLVEPCEVSYTPQVHHIAGPNSSDRTPYYNIKTEPGTITILKRDVSIDIAPHTDPIVWRYSDDSLENELAAYDKLDITPRLENDGTIAYDCKIFNSDGKDVTESCYNLTVNDASGKTRYYYSLEATVDGNTSAYHAKYDGKKHYFGVNVIKDDSIDDDFDTKISVSGDAEGIYNDYGFSAYKPGHVIGTPMVEAIYGSRMSMGEYAIDDTSMFFYDPTSTTSASMHIEPRDLVIDISGTRVYEGELLGTPLKANEFTLGGDGLASTDSIKITPRESTILTGGSVVYDVEITNPSFGAVNDCYNIEINDHMSYQKASLTLTSYSSDNTWDYDGEAHNPNVTGDARGDDVINVTTDISDSGGKTNAGTYDFETKGVSITKGKTDVSKYYDITNPDYGSSMTINKIDVNLTFFCHDGFDTSTYSSMRDLIDYYSFDRDDLDLEVLAVDFDQVPSTPGSYDIADFTNYVYVMKDGVDVTDNLNIHVHGVFKILEGRVSISAPTYYKTYDGNEIFGDVSKCIIKFTEGMEKEGYKVVDIVLEGSITTPGSITLRIVSFTIVDGKGNVVTMPTTINDGTLTVTPRNITIATADVYDYVGEDVSGGSPYIISGTLAEGDNLIFMIESGHSNYYDHAGTYPNDGWIIIIGDKDGNDVTAYYNITIIWGNIYIED